MVRAKGVLEFGAATGVLLFVVLSVMYDAFYGPLGLEPEDVGLTQTVIVQRALAGVAAIAATGLATVVLFLAFQSLLYLQNLAIGKWYRRMNPDSGRGVARLLAQDDKVARRLKTLDRWSSYITVMPPLQMLGVTEPSPAPWTRRRQPLILAALLTFAILLFTFTIGLDKVEDAAQRAQNGGSVTPLTFGGVRVLDIESRSCRVTWLGTAVQRPEALASRDLHCLGSASATAVFRTSEETIRVPSSLVIISSD